MDGAAAIRSDAAVTHARMHDDEVPVDDALVRRLLTDQQPALADRPLERVTAMGTDHVIYRLGDDLAVRLPRIWWAQHQATIQQRWLPALAAGLTIEVPVPTFLGEPAAGYPYPWCVVPWLVGERPNLDDVDMRTTLAADLAGVVRDLQAIPVPDGAPRPRPGRRAGPLAGADERTRERAEELRGETDVDALLAVWQAGIEARPWDRPPVWVHGDLSDGNVLVRDAHLTGVIDWGGLVAGDPAPELMVAWSLFDAGSRVAFRDALGWVDEDTWLRGRAWATSAAIQALPYYRDTNPDIVARSWRTVEAVLAEASG